MNNDATKMSGHTPTPWMQVMLHPQIILGKGQISGERIEIVTDATKGSTEQNIANAAFIVLCCNEWEALNAVAEATDMALQEYDAPPIGLSGNHCGIIKELRTALAALAKLREEKQ